MYVLLKAYSKATEVETTRGYLPLHLAFNFDASNDVINMLLKANPKAAQSCGKAYATKFCSMKHRLL